DRHDVAPVGALEDVELVGAPGARRDERVAIHAEDRRREHPLGPAAARPRGRHQTLASSLEKTTSPSSGSLACARAASTALRSVYRRGNLYCIFPASSVSTSPSRSASSHSSVRRAFSTGWPVRSAICLESASGSKRASGEAERVQISRSVSWRSSRALRRLVRRFFAIQRPA